MIRVVIVEDDEDFAFLVQKLLNKQKDIEVIGCCPDREAVLEMIYEKKPDIVLMDLNLGVSHLDGIRLSREIRIRTDAKVLILTAFETPDMIFRAAEEAFASGYLFKSQMSFLVENIAVTYSKFMLIIDSII